MTTLFTFKKWSVRINKSYVGTVYTSSDNLNYLPPYFLMNSSLKYYLENIQTEFTISIDNILNNEYQTYQNYPNPGRNFLIQLNINLK